jgi:hypothetical protein
VTEIFQLKEVSSSKVERLRFRFVGFGWASVFIHDIAPCCGELVIYSDWGTWAYTWGGMTEGEKLGDFLIKADNGYIASKLIPGREKDEWDPKETKKHLLKEIDEWVENEPVRSELVRELKEAVEECDWDSGSTLWYERAPEILHKHFDPLYERMYYKPTGQYSILKDKLLPTIKKYLKDHRD